MSRNASPTALVVLASEQTWPNLHSVVHWHEHAGGRDGLLATWLAGRFADVVIG